MSACIYNSYWHQTCFHKHPAAYLLHFHSDLDCCNPMRRILKLLAIIMSQEITWRKACIQWLYRTVKCSLHNISAWLYNILMIPCHLNLLNFIWRDIAVPYESTNATRYLLFSSLHSGSFRGDQYPLIYNKKRSLNMSNIEHPSIHTILSCNFCIMSHFMHKSSLPCKTKVQNLLICVEGNDEVLNYKLLRV